MRRTGTALRTGISEPIRGSETTVRGRIIGMVIPSPSIMRRMTVWQMLGTSADSTLALSMTGIRDEDHLPSIKMGDLSILSYRLLFRKLNLLYNPVG
jgi:hypothetical protein